MTARRTEVRSRHGLAGELAAPLAIIAAFAVAGMVWVAAAAAAKLADTPVPGNPAAYLLELAQGDADWPGTWATRILLAEVGVVLASIAVLLRWRSRRCGRGGADAVARRMAGPAELATFTPAGAAAKAARLRPHSNGTDTGTDSSPAGHGVVLGATVSGRRQVLRSSWEDVSVDINGPRRGKTSARAIPAVLDAPGVVIATSNKRDLLDATRKAREDRGGTVWVFDPQNLAPDARATHAGQDSPAAPNPWFDPLATITSITDAQALVGIFRAAETDTSTRRDAYFAPAGEALLAGAFLAAARTRTRTWAMGTPATLLDVYRWVMDPTDLTPVDVLTASGDATTAEQLRAFSNLNPRQLDGVYGHAQTLLHCLADPARARWVIPGDGPQLHPEKFIASATGPGPDTLYLLSQEGPGSAAALVGALVQAILDEGVRVAAHRGRLDPPLLAVLDEAANVCPLPRLPNLYSHLGSRGLVVATFLQSWAHGTRVWGEDGMSALWSAATVRVYGGGEADTRFLESLSQLIGEHEVIENTVSYNSRGERTYGQVRHRERTMPVSALANLPLWRAVLFTATAEPALIELVPWWSTGHHDAVEASLDAYSPDRPAGVTMR